MEVNFIDELLFVYLVVVVVVVVAAVVVRVSYECWGWDMIGCRHSKNI